MKSLQSPSTPSPLTALSWQARLAGKREAAQNGEPQLKSRPQEHQRGGYIASLGYLKAQDGTSR